MAQTGRVSFVTPSEKREALELIAEATGQNLSAVINDALDHYVELYQWQIAHIEKGVAQANAGEFASDKEMKTFFDGARP